MAANPDYMSGMYTYKTYEPVSEYPIERNDLARDLFMQFLDAGEYADPLDVAARAFDAAEAFMLEMKRRDEQKGGQ